MKKVAIVSCGAYVDSGFGCPGEWRCLKAAALGEGSFDEPSTVVSMVTCECPTRSISVRASQRRNLVVPTSSRRSSQRS
jgi:predicted metal-binding protein